MSFHCRSCGTKSEALHATCHECGGFVRYTTNDTEALQRATSGDPTAALPDFTPTVSMGEGETPLVELDATSATVYGKLESLNPTCSFKDRGSSLIVSAVADEQTSWEGIIVASTGNTAPSVAAYAARAGIPCAVVVPEDTSLSKLSQVKAHGIDIYTTEGTFSDCFRVAQRASDERLLNATAVYSANPFVASANRTVAFEIVEQLGTVPDWVTVPVGAGPLLGGTYQGFVELEESGIVESRPRMLCVQAEGCHPIVEAFEAEEPVRPWLDPITTTVGAIADPLDGYVEDGEETRYAVVDSDGGAVALTDEQIYDWTDRLAETEGIYAEPASAASVAAVESSYIDEDDDVIALITGHGLKEQADVMPSAESFDGDPSTLRKAVLDH